MIERWQSESIWDNLVKIFKNKRLRLAGKFLVFMNDALSTPGRIVSYFIVTLYLQSVSTKRDCVRAMSNRRKVIAMVIRALLVEQISFNRQRKALNYKQRGVPRGLFCDFTLYRYTTQKITMTESFFTIRNTDKKQPIVMMSLIVMMSS